MRVGLRIASVGVFSAVIVAMIGAARAQPDPDAAAAARGKTAYGESCATCHGADLGGSQFGPPLSGPGFKSSWSAAGSSALLTFITTKMPPGGPGSLSSDAYAGVAAYLLRSNGIPAGADLQKSAQAGPRSPASAPAPNPEGPGRLPMIHDAVSNAVIARRQAKLEKLTPVTDAMLRHPTDADWLVWRGNYQALGYSRLDQINKRTVSGLHPAWSWSLPLGQDEITPLVHDGVLFVESGNAVQALDGATGDLLWQYVHPMPAIFNNGRNSRTKSMAIFKDMIFVPFPDGRMVALDMKTGKSVWEHAVVAPDLADRHGGAEGLALLMDGGPIVANGKVIIGVSLGQSNSKGGCFILAMDAQTGNEVWRFNTIARPGEPGGDSWNGAPVDQRYGAGVWTAGSYDPDLNLVYFGTGNTYDTATLLVPNPKQRPENYGLYTDSTLAINADTGKLAWAFQHVHRDVWDLDWVFEQTLVTVPVNGQPKKLVVTGGKIALFDALDRATGKYVFSKDAGLQNLVTAIDPKTGEKTINPAAEPEPGKAKSICPSSFGARNWPATSFDPQTKILYLPLLETCMDYTFMPRSAQETAAGGADLRLATHPRPDSDGKYGRVEAINLETGKTVWTRRQRSPSASSMLATAGGLVFNGGKDRFFNAYDAATGDVLWRTRLNAPPSSSPVTYSVNGKQYVAVVAGGGGPFDGLSGSVVPEIENPAPGVTLWIFELSGSRAAPKAKAH